MNKLFTLSLALCAGIAANAQTIHPAGVPGCIARYDMNTLGGAVTAVADVSANGNNSYQVTNLIPTTNFRNKPNKALLFDGGTSNIKVANSPTLQLANAEVTMVGLVRVDSFYAGTCQGTSILNKGFTDHTAGNYWLRFTDNPSDGDDCVAYDSTKQNAVASFGQAWYPANPLPYVRLGNWMLIVATYNGTEATIYQIPMNPNNKLENIAPDATYTVSGPIGTNTLDITIGMMDLPSHPYWFGGAMDEVAIFNRGLDNEEVYKIYSYLWDEPVNVEGTAAQQPLSLYPNPANSSITLQGAIGNGNVLVQVYNAVGQVVATETVTNNNGNLQHTINTAGLPAGAYMSKVSNSSGNQSIRFSVQH